MKTYFSNNTTAFSPDYKAVLLQNSNSLFKTLLITFKMFSNSAKRVITNVYTSVYASGKITNNSVRINLQATGGDSRPYRERRMDAKLCDQDVAQGFKDRRLKDDSRPYRERRLDAKLCDQDVAQGFKDRRLRVKVVDLVIDMSVIARVIAPALGETARYITPTSPPLAQEDRRGRLVKEIAKETIQRQLQAEMKMKQFEEELAEKKRLELPIIKNPEMVLKMTHWFRLVPGFKLTDDFYRENIQFIRDQVGFARDLEIECEHESDTIHFSVQTRPIRKQRIIV